MSYPEHRFEPDIEINRGITDLNKLRIPGTNPISLSPVNDLFIETQDD